MNRRRFVKLAVGTGASASASSLLGPAIAWANPTDHACWRDPACAAGQKVNDWITVTPATHYRPYLSKRGKTAETVSWVQVDLGSAQSIDTIRLYPAGGLDGWPFPFGFGTFPLRFKIEASADASFSNPRLIANFTASDFPDPKDQIIDYQAQESGARYVRLTVNRMRQIPNSNEFAFAISKISVLDAGVDLAEHCATTADNVYGNEKDLRQLTRAPRPQGEGMVTDHAENVTPASSWQAVEYQAQVPQGGVTLDGGLFKTAFEQNITYLLDSFTVDQLLRQFRDRAGEVNPPNLPTPNKFWEEDLAGSNAGRFLMGAGNSLRWVEHSELRRRLNAVVDGIEACKQPNGYIMAYPEDTIFYSERGNYTRSWVTRGLILAGYSGNEKAFNLLRGYYDWFDRCTYLPELLRRASFGGQGMIPNTLMYFTPVGKPEDIQVIQRFYQENYWLDNLAEHKEEAVWQYPYDRPHCYEVTFWEAYLDLYRATGSRHYLDAMLGAWDLYHDNWENVGGSTAIEEFVEDPPRSYRLDHKHGELCGSVFWICFNQRLHLLYPEQEKYVTEIEKSIYNVALANQAGSQGIRYFAVLVGPKEKPTRDNTCCEGSGTRLLGSLPEHIYSIATDGIYVNLFEPSTISWNEEQESLQLRMTTQFPFHPDVQIQVHVSQPIQGKVRVRVPSWAASDMPIKVNSKMAASGTPGTYAVLDRTWSPGDTISFTLPMKLRLTRYVGRDQIEGHERYALEFGPILLAAVGSNELTLRGDDSNPEDFLAQLKQKPDQPLHFSIEHNPGVEYMPYWEVTDQQFTCFPVLDLQRAWAAAS